MKSSQFKLIQFVVFEGKLIVDVNFFIANNNKNKTEEKNGMDAIVVLYSWELPWLSRRLLAWPSSSSDYN